jgi:lysophospholipase L1-like esterase
MITHILWLYLALFTAQPTIRADPEPPADRAAPRADANSFIAHGELLAKKTQGRIDVYFLGDSIVRRWGATDYPQLLASWKANFFGWNAANFGWGADRIEHVLWRLENGELDDVHPKVIVIQAGTNNVGNAPGDASKIANITRGVQALVDTCRRKAPNATIILTAIFPRNDNVAVMPEINRINENLARVAQQSGIRFLDINSRLADGEGRLFPDVMNADNLHPSVKGYQVWADALKPLLTEILGPPGQQDLAPPPTGDPGASHRREGRLVPRLPYDAWAGTGSSI